MTSFKKQLAGALATGLLIANIASPLAAFAEDGIHLEMSGNGANSTSTINSAVSNTTTVTQTNEANVYNDVSSKADSGNNTAYGNTNGDVLIHTGDATSDVSVLNDLNKNLATVDCCEPTDTEVVISGNGAYSTNEVGLSQTSANTLAQTNAATVENKVDSKANSGWNKASFNTGGDNTIITGDADASAQVVTNANVNVGTIGGNGDHDGSVSLWITGNGANSDNDIKLALAKSNLVAQTNLANVYNDVYAKADSGYNKLYANTGGDSAILTGDANAEVMVDNHVNFNYADIDCGCVTDVLAKISGNGFESDNDINASIVSDQIAAQTNLAGLLNDVDAKAKSGDNKVKWSTGPVEDDPVVIMTGDASSATEVTNASNWNVFGTGELSPLPWPDFDFDVDFDFDWWFLGWHSS